MKYEIAGIGLACAIGFVIARSMRRPNIPFLIVLLQGVASGFLWLFKRFTVADADLIPSTGPVILVANHTTAYDPVAMQVACKDRLIRFMQAREFYDQKPFIYLYRLLHVIPVNRNGRDTAGVRAALRELANGGCIGIFPEGRISNDGRLQEARQGVALLALASNARVVPAYFHGTRPFAGMVRDFMQFDRVTLQFGAPIQFDDLKGRHRDPQARDIALARIMAAIAALRDETEGADPLKVGHGY